MATPAEAVPRHTLVLGRYRPVRPLGSGGSGSVWLAWDEAAGIEVALKIIPRQGKAAPRAEREAAAGGRLRHERCLRVHALGEDERHVYIAYEYVPGRTLREAIRAGELDDAAAVETGAQILEGLAHAHARGIVHRDVKPSNVLLADGDDVSVRLLDFGLAQMDEAETLTAVGDVPGTLAYIAPERLAGGDASEASDVWAVGVLLWEALAGWHPFWRSSLLESARAIETGPPSLATARPDLPKALIAAVDRALSLNPARRPSADKLAVTLRRGRVDRRRPDSTGASVQVHPLLAAAAPALLAGAFAGWAASALPFFPEGFFLALGATAGALSAWRPRVGLVFALAVPVLPIGNHSLGLACVYTAVALGWLALFAREPRTAFLPVLGPLLAPVAALGLLPLALRQIRSPLRRGAAALAAVAVAAIVAGTRAVPIPFERDAVPALGLERVADPLVAWARLSELAAGNPSLLLISVVLGLAAAAAPYTRRYGVWGAAAVPAVLISSALLLDPGLSPAGLMVTGWVTFAALVFEAAHQTAARG